MSAITVLDTGEVAAVGRIDGSNRLHFAQLLSNVAAQLLAQEQAERAELTNEDEDGTVSGPADDEPVGVAVAQNGSG